MSSHLGEGRYKRIWYQKIKIVMHMEIFNFCQISVFLNFHFKEPTATLFFACVF